MVFINDSCVPFSSCPNCRTARKCFSRAVEIADLMFGLSVLDNGMITNEMGAEAERAVIAYLGTYVPENLPRRRGLAKLPG